MDPSAEPTRPSAARFALEARAWPELLSTLATWPLLARGATRGDGAGVLVLPGWLADDLSTRVMRRLLRDVGYYAHGWRLGRNYGPASHRIVALERRLLDLAERYGAPLTLIGWSLGGLYARELARRRRGAVRQVIALASPLRAPVASLVAASFAREVGRNVENGSPAPLTAIYSRSDGVVPWQHCLVEPGPLRENIEVPSSHCGMGHHPVALWLVAQRLAQPVESWAPLDLRGSAARLFRARPAPAGAPASA
jgi:pimeloyl-ACP methyl ester carboxylesterase